MFLNKEQARQFMIIGGIGATIGFIVVCVSFFQFHALPPANIDLVAVVSGMMFGLGLAFYRFI